MYIGMCALSPINSLSCPVLPGAHKGPSGDQLGIFKDCVLVFRPLKFPSPELETAGQESSSDAEVIELSREDRPGSPFGRSRHTTPHCSQRRQRRSKSCNPGTSEVSASQPAPASLTPSPLDLGYQTLEHSFCETGDSSVDSPLRDPRLEPGVTRGLEKSEPCHLLRLPNIVILKLLGYLNSRELARVAVTCRQLRHLCWSESLWTSIVLAGESLDTDRAVRAILSRLVWAREGRDGAPCVTTVVLSGCARYGR